MVITQLKCFNYVDANHELKASYMYILTEISSNCTRVTANKHDVCITSNSFSYITLQFYKTRDSNFLCWKEELLR